MICGYDSYEIVDARGCAAGAFPIVHFCVIIIRVEPSENQFSFNNSCGG